VDLNRSNQSDLEDAATREKLELHFGSNKAALETFVAYVDESNFALADWVESLGLLHIWLSDQQLDLGLNDSIEYLHCASKISPNAQALTTLARLTEEFLELYGCERATKIK